MSINKHNYEAFFLDYVEGNLPAEVVAELLLFLEENPTLKRELDGFNLIELNAPNKIQFNKESLKVTVNDSNIDDYIIGSIEGLNTEVDEKELITFISNNKESQQLLSRYKKTILVAPEVIFSQKYLLKKRSRVVALYPLIGIAASLLLFFMLSSNNEQQEYHPQSIIAIETSESETIEEVNNFIASELQIETERNEAEESISALPITKDSVPKTFIQPNNDLAIEFKDSTSNIPIALEVPSPEELIVANDSTNENKLDSISAFIEPSNNDLTVNEWANQQIKNKVLNQENPDGSKIEKDEVFDAIAGGLNKISKQEITYNSYASNNTITKGFSIGNFEFSRTKRNKY